MYYVLCSGFVLISLVFCLIDTFLAYSLVCSMRGGVLFLGNVIFLLDAVVGACLFISIVSFCLFRCIDVAMLRWCVGV